MIYLCSEAVRNQSPIIDVSDGIVPFLRDMGMSISGRTFRNFKNQMAYLAGCEMQLAWDAGHSIKKTRCAPVHSFEAWADPFASQKSFWPDEIKLGQEYKFPKDFKKKFAPAMRKVLTVYPTANVRQEHGGMRLFPSPPPIRKTQVITPMIR
jgi:hypothetical protein